MWQSPLHPVSWDASDEQLELYLAYLSGSGNGPSTTFPWHSLPISEMLDPPKYVTCLQGLPRTHRVSSSLLGILPHTGPVYSRVQIGYEELL